MKFLLVLSLSLAAALAATASFADEIDPVGDETLGSLVVEAPPLPAAPATFAPYTLDFSGAALKPSVSERFVEGTRQLAVRVPSLGYSIAAPVAVTRRELTTVKLSSLGVRWDAQAVAVDLGPAFTFSLGFGSQVVKSADTAWAPDSTLLLPLLAGDVRAEFSPGLPLQGLDARDWSVPAGENMMADLTPASDVRARVAVELAPASFPDPALPCGRSGVFALWRQTSSISYADRDGIQTPVPSDLAYGRASGSYGVRGFSQLPRDRAEPLRMFAFAGTTDRYELVAANTSLPIAAAGGGITRFALRRVDVNDVKVTREDGSTYLSAGTWELFRRDPTQSSGWTQIRLPVAGRTSSGSCVWNGATIFAQDFPTKTGLDVFPDVYKVRVSYPTEEGPKVDEIPVDLSK
jgi:hypothetical protein